MRPRHLAIMLPIVAVTAAVIADENEKPADVLCPVMGEPVDFSVKTDADDGPVYFCCKRCISRYESTPEKYASALAQQRSALAKRDKVQVTCPVREKPIKTDAFTEQGGEKIHFCCKMCISRYENDPQRYAGKLAAAYTYQTECPVSGRDIDPTASMEVGDAGTIYFCCERCIQRFKDDPTAYADKLKKQGYATLAKAAARKQ